MGTLGTFDSFTTARLGIYAAQHGLRVTGNNISNINTTGYTRQRIDQVSFKTGVNDRYKSMLDNHVGSGALVTGTNQIRDPYLDIRYRTTTSEVEHQQTKLKGLEEIAKILDEVGKGQDSNSSEKGDGLLYQYLQDLATKLRAYSASPTKDNEILVRGSASTLTSLFNKYAIRLNELEQDYKDDFNKNIEKANEILTNIQALNKSIRECEITGDKALEMRDQRNLQIDELSKLMAIRVEYSMEDVGAGVQVEKLTIRLDNQNPDKTVETDSSILVDGLYATQLSVPKEKPSLNPYKGMSDDELNALPTPLDGDYKDLQGYLFIAKVTELPADKDTVEYDYVKLTDPDTGDEYYLMGTNDPAAEGVIKEPNNNYTIQLGKLLDTHGEEWRDIETTWFALGKAPTKAVYSYDITSTGNWAYGNELVIGGTTYTVGPDPNATPDPAKNYVGLDVVNNSASLANFIAGKLNEIGNTDYDITASGNQIIYTAKNGGAVGGGKGGPAAEPDLTLTPVTGANVTLGNREVVTAGEDGDTIVEDPPADTTTDPLTGVETEISYVERSGKIYRLTIERTPTREVVLDDNDLYGSLQAQRELLTEEGEFSSTDDVLVDENAMIKRGIPYYRKSFDLLAQKFAEAYNQLNTGYQLNQKGNYIDKDGKELMLPGTDGVATAVNKYNGLSDSQKENLIANGYFTEDKAGNKVVDLNRWLEENGAVKMGGPLFSNNNDGDDITGITAANITLSHSWSTGAVELVPKFEVLFLDENGNKLPNTTQNTNADHMVTMIDKALTYDPRDLNGFGDAEGPLLFQGSFNDMFSNLMGVQADDARITSAKLLSSTTTQVELESSREGVSGVDLNDEAMNMMQYQKAMNAAMRLMTTIDEALDRLINNTGVAGR